MRTILILALISLSTISCKKEDETISPQNQSNTSQSHSYNSLNGTTWILNQQLKQLTLIQILLFSTRLYIIIQITIILTMEHIFS